MKYRLPELEPEQPPKGKRTVRATRYGTTRGYIAGRYWLTIGDTYAAGTAEAVAEFLAGEER